ncbi:MAG: RES domain-containing protein [Burkholderiaceae bacterium]|nr:MAG: RES domain-containing protein [Burkholderiaceae bacterium]
MSLRLPDAGSFEHLLEEVPVSANSLLRLSKYPKSEPFWSRGRYRFDGPPGGFGTCYAAVDVAVAFSESVIHECAWFRNGQYEIPMADLISRHIVKLHRPARPDLVLADLTGTALKRLGLNNDISAGSDYTVPMAWAKAIHDADLKWDGIRYVSRQDNSEFAFALFERSGLTKTSSRKLASKVLDNLCDTFGVVAV